MYVLRPISNHFTSSMHIVRHDIALRIRGKILKGNVLSRRKVLGERKSSMNPMIVQKTCILLSIVASYITVNWEYRKVASQFPCHGIHPKTTVYIIARTYPGASRSRVESFLYSLKAQTYQNYEVALVNSERPCEEVFPDLVLGMNDRRFSTITLDIENPHRGHSYGYPVTEALLNTLLRSLEYRTHLKLRYILLTNADNLYHSLFLESQVKVFETEVPRPCLVGCDWVSRYHELLPDGSFGRRNRVRIFQPRRNQMDLGAALVSLASIRETFGKSTVFRRNDTRADFAFFSSLIGFPTCVRMSDGVLFVHQ